MPKRYGCSSLDGLTALRLSLAEIGGRSRFPTGRELLLPDLRFSPLEVRRGLSPNPSHLLLHPLLRSRQRSRTISGNSTSSAHSALSVAGTLTLSLVASTLNAPPTPRGTLKRTLNEMENDVKSSSADDDGGGKVRISDKVLGGRLVAEWNVEKKWSGGLEVSSTFALEPVHVVRPRLSSSSFPHLLCSRRDEIQQADWSCPTCTGSLEPRHGRDPLQVASVARERAHYGVPQTCR